MSRPRVPGAHPPLHVFTDTHPTAVVEHAAGPSAPASTSMGVAYRGSMGLSNGGPGRAIDDVEYEGFEVEDGEEEEEEDAGMVQAVSRSPVDLAVAL